MGAAGVTKPRLKQKAHRQLDLSISSNTNLVPTVEVREPNRLRCSS